MHLLWLKMYAPAVDELAADASVDEREQAAPLADDITLGGDEREPTSLAPGATVGFAVRSTQRRVAPWAPRRV